MRYLTSNLEEDLAKKMVFLVGPRQCGKTTLSLLLLKKIKDGLYLNWDDLSDRKKILKRDWNDSDLLIILDEVHKLKSWKNFLKGTFDTQKSKHFFLITGSAKLDSFRMSGDSLQGRYFSWRLHPFCMAENPLSLENEAHFQRLLERGGFPEPYLAQNLKDAKRWRKSKAEQIFREEIRDLQEIRDLKTLELLHLLLLERVGGAVVYSNLATDLHVSAKTVKNWTTLFEKLFLIFLIYPHTEKLTRSLVKTPKIYSFDNGDITQENKGALFENFVATQLLKRINYLEDSEGDKYELKYLRDKEKHEVDFTILKNRKVICLIECKWSDTSVSTNLEYFSKKLKVNHLVQLVGIPIKRFQKNSVKVISAQEWFSCPVGTNLFEG